MNAFDEVTARHEFFELWFSNQLDESSFDQAMTVFADSFVYIGPSGTAMKRDALINGLRGQRGSKPKGFVIEIKSMQTLYATAEMSVVSYIEVQADETPAERRSTALFTVDLAAPHGVIWQYVQETWIEGT